MKPKNFPGRKLRRQVVAQKKSRKEKDEVLTGEEYAVMYITARAIRTKKDRSVKTYG